MIPDVRVICFTMVLSAFSFCASAEDFTNAVRAFLQQRVEVEKRDVGIVVGIVDESGSRVVSYGKMDNGTDEEVNGDTAVLTADGFSAKKDLLAQLLASRRSNPDPIVMRSEVFYFGGADCCLNFSLLLPVLQNISRLAFQRFANRLQG